MLNKSFLATSPTRRLAMLGTALLLGASALPAMAQTAAYPTKPIRWIVPYNAGGGQ